MISILLSGSAFAAETFYVRTDGDADNGGSTNAAAAVSSGATATTAASVLTQIGATFVTDGVTTDDSTNLKSGTGITPGIYHISGVTQTTLTLESDPGNSAAGDIVFKVGGAWTAQAGADNTEVSDECLWQAGTYTLTAAIDFDTNSGANGADDHFVKHTADGGTVVIDADNTAANCFTSDKTLIVWGVNASTDSWELKNATGDGWDANTAGSELVIMNFDIHTNGGDGFDGFRIKMRANNSAFRNNSGHGYNDRVSSSLADSFINCKFHDNSGHGINQRTTGPVVLFCDFYDNTLKGLDVVWDDVIFMYNTVYGNGNGIQNDVNTVHSWFFMNNIIKGHNGVGDIGYDGNSAHEFAVVNNNCWHDNTTDVDAMTKGPDAVNEDPTFTSVTDGSEDFNLLSGSPCIGTAYPNTSGPGVIDANQNIGSHQQAAGGETSSVF